MDYRLTKIYKQLLQNGPSVTATKSITNAYQEVLLHERSLSGNAQLRVKIQSENPTLKTNPSGHQGIRIQPTGTFSHDELLSLFKKLNLEVIKKINPYEQGSYSGQLPTYHVKDSATQQDYFIVLGKGTGFSKRDELAVVDSIAQQIQAAITKEQQEFIQLSIVGDVKKVDGVRSTPGNPKSDFEFTFQNNPVFWISHKDGTKASDHQQYGGLTCVSGKPVCGHPETMSFVEEISKRYGQGMPPGTSVWRKIKDSQLKLLSIFGFDYGSNFGPNNVTALYQGNVTLVPKGNNVYEINAAHSVFNGQLPTGTYEPILYGRFSGSRGGNHGIKDLRTGILPLAKASTKAIQI